MSHTIDQRRHLQQVWQSSNSFATSLLVLFLDTYGTEGLTWDPSTMVLEIEEDFNISLPQIVFDRLLAAIAIVTTDGFYRNLPDFINLCNILSGDTYDPNLWDPADVAEIAWGLTEGMLLSPPEDDDESPFSEEILAYIGAALDTEGIIHPPDILRLATRDRDWSNWIQGEFSDDPDLFQGIYEFEESKTSDINSMLRGNLTSLLQQLSQLPLIDGNVEDLLPKLRNALGHAIT